MVRVEVIEKRIESPVNREQPETTGAVLEYHHILRDTEAEARAILFDGDLKELQAALTEIAEFIAEEYELVAMEVQRRVGRVPVGESCLWVRVTAAHAHEAFRAMSEFLGALKRIDIPSEPVVPA